MRLGRVEAGFSEEPAQEDVYAEEGGGVQDAHVVQPARGNSCQRVERGMNRKGEREYTSCRQRVQSTS